MSYNKGMSKYLLLLIFLFAGNCFASIKIGITVDDLPAAGSNYSGIDRYKIAEKYLQTYKKYGFPPQYGFLNGVYLEGMSERYKILTLWKNSGHYFGNHTYSHKGLEALGSVEFKKDIEHNESFLIDFAKNIVELKYLRFPFLDEGSSNELRYSIRSYLKNRNYKIAQVSIDTSDWQFNSSYIRCMEKKDKESAQKIINSFVATVEKIVHHRDQEAKFIWGAQKDLNHVILLHLTPLLADSSEDLFAMFKKNNWNIIDAKKALDDNTYSEDTTFVNKNGKDYIIQSLMTRGYEKRTLSAPKIPEFLKEICQ